MLLWGGCCSRMGGRWEAMGSTPDTVCVSGGSGWKITTRNVGEAMQALAKGT